MVTRTAPCRGPDRGRATRAAGRVNSMLARPSGTSVVSSLARCSVSLPGISARTFAPPALALLLRAGQLTDPQGGAAHGVPCCVLGLSLLGLSQKDVWSQAP